MKNPFRLFKRKPNDASLVRAFEKLDQVNLGAALAEEGISHRTLRNFDAAIQAFREALYEHEYYPAVTLIGNTYAEMGDFEQAKDWFQEAIKGYSGEHGRGAAFLVELYLNLAVVHHATGDIDEAVEVNEGALSLVDMISDPDIQMLSRSGVYRNFAFLKCDADDPVSADRYFCKALELNPNCVSSRAALPEVRRARYSSFRKQVSTSPIANICYSIIQNSFGLPMFETRSAELLQIVGHFNISDPFSDYGIDTLISSVWVCLDRRLFVDHGRPGVKVLSNWLIDGVNGLRMAGIDVAQFPCPMDPASVNAISLLISACNAYDIRLSE